MKVAVPKEIVEDERRVALVPQSAAELAKLGVEVLLESGAGEAALFPDKLYKEVGATIVPNMAELFEAADVILKIQKPVVRQDMNLHEVELMREGAILCTFLQPMTDLELVRRLMERRITSFSMDAIPRIARAQSMDALSSMASVAGYKAALIAANSMARFFPMMVTAAGTFAPAKGLVLGAGVAGLQSIATARRIGAVMSAYDVRLAAKEQVESLGASFIEAPIDDAESADGYAKELTQESQEREIELIYSHIVDMDFVITTAAIPGRHAPMLITNEMVRDMRDGSVIVDIAAETGGNCTLTKPGVDVLEYGVTICGPLNLASLMPTHASQMYSRNISSLLRLLIRDNKIHLDFEDEIVNGCCITHAGHIVHGLTSDLMHDYLGE